LSLDDWNATITTNLTSTFLCTRAVIDPMSERGGGRIINISSAIATRPAFGAAAYSASKAAVEMFTRTSAVELRSKRINVNNLAPGIVNAGMGPDLVANPRAWDAYRPRLLAGRLGRPEEIGAAAVFLASAESSYINGTTIEVNGGWT
jgi:3-oxoacyl-[acyl-carrier protein] reductase